MSWFYDPRVFNYVLFTLYLLNTIRWVFEGKYYTALYWIGALLIVVSVTWGMKE